MARKASDMVLLLGSRGQYRGRNTQGFLPRLRRFASTAFEVMGLARKGSGRRGETRASRGVSASGLVLLAGALLCFGGGYFVGSASGKGATPGTDLNAKGGPQQPAVIGEFDAKALSNDAFIVSVYPGVEAGEAKLRAKALSDYLRDQNLLKARPFEYPTANGPLWVVAVYHDGDAEREATRARLKLLPQDVPDETFTKLRKTEADWPTTWPIR